MQEPSQGVTVLAPIHMKSCQLMTPFQVCHKKCSLQESLTIIEGGGEFAVRVQILDLRSITILF